MISYLCSSMIATWSFKSPRAEFPTCQTATRRFLPDPLITINRYVSQSANTDGLRGYITSVSGAQYYLVFEFGRRRIVGVKVLDGGLTES